jgi:hypothetical protein
MKISLKLFEEEKSEDDYSPKYSLFAQIEKNDEKRIIFSQNFFDEFRWRTRKFHEKYKIWNQIRSFFDFKALTDEKQQLFLQDYISHGYVTEFEIKDGIDVSNFIFTKEIFYTVIMSDLKEKPEVLIFQEETSTGEMKLFSNNIPYETKNYYVVCFGYFGKELIPFLEEGITTSDKILDIKQEYLKLKINQQNQNRINYLMLRYMNAKYKVDSTFFNLMLFVKPSSKDIKMIEEHPSFNKYYNFLSKRRMKDFPKRSIVRKNEKYDYEQVVTEMIFPSIKTEKSYGGKEITLKEDDSYLAKNTKTMTNIVLNSCESGKLKLKIIPKGTLLYFMTVFPVTEDNLNKNQTVWTFWTEDDLTDYKINLYLTEYRFRILNVFTVREELHLLNLSDPDTILRLFSDGRLNYEERQHIAYSFSVNYTDIKKDEFHKNKSLNKEVSRCSHEMMDDYFLNVLKKYYPEFEGIIYYVGDNSKYHHNEMAIFNSSKLNIKYNIPLNTLKTLTNFIYRQDWQWNMMNENVKGTFSLFKYSIEREYPAVIYSLNNIIDSFDNFDHLKDYSTEVRNILFSIVSGYLSQNNTIVRIRYKSSKFEYYDLEIRSNINDCRKRYSLTFNDNSNQEIVLKEMFKIFETFPLLTTELSKFDSKEKTIEVDYEFISVLISEICTMETLLCLD